MKNILFILLAFLSVSFRLYAQDVIKIGIIGLDTSHSTAFTELLNGDSDDKFVKQFRYGRCNLHTVFLDLFYISGNSFVTGLDSL